MAIFAGAVPAAPVYDVGQALDAPFTRSTGQIVEQETSSGGAIRTIGPGVRQPGLPPKAEGAPVARGRPDGRARRAWLFAGGSGGARSGRGPEGGGGMKDFQGKTAVVTGAASGIGLGLARAFGRHGARVALLDIEAAALEKAAAELKAEGIDARPYPADVTDRTGLAAVAIAVTGDLGHVHVLCNNAGVGTADPLQVARAEDWDWVLAVNLNGVVNGLLAFLPAMVDHGEESHIVNTASVAGLHAMREIGVYNTSKFAVIGLTETLRDDLAGTPIGVSALCPGYVNTNINQSRRNRQDRFGPSRPPQMSKDAMREIDRMLKTRGMEPDELGEMVVDAIGRGLFYIITDPAFWLPIRRRFERMSADLIALHGGLPGSA